MTKTYRVSLTKVNKIAHTKCPEIEKIKYAQDGSHKYIALVGKKKIKFGLLGAQDYLTHKDPERKKRYLARHKGMNEDWSKPSPGRYAAKILWDG